MNLNLCFYILWKCLNYNFANRLNNPASSQQTNELFMLQYDVLTYRRPTALEAAHLPFVHNQIQVLMEHNGRHPVLRKLAER